MISRILANFRPCFSRKAAFNWFVVVVFGFIVRLDHCNVSSFVRWLGIRPELYTALVSNFRAKSWRLPVIMYRWWQIVLEHLPKSTFIYQNAVRMYFCKRAIADDLLMKEGIVMSPQVNSVFVTMTFQKQRDFVPKNHI